MLQIKSVESGVCSVVCLPSLVLGSLLAAHENLKPHFRQLVSGHLFFFFFIPILPMQLPIARSADINPNLLHSLLSKAWKRAAVNEPKEKIAQPNSR